MYYLRDLARRKAYFLRQMANKAYIIYDRVQEEKQILMTICSKKKSIHFMTLASKAYFIHDN
jgi:hypothetical protein